MWLNELLLVKDERNAKFKAVRCNERRKNVKIGRPKEPRMQSLFNILSPRVCPKPLWNSIKWLWTNSYIYTNQQVGFESTINKGR